MVQDKATQAMTGQERYTFTVFTPTFERASTLTRVKDSLESQTYQDFEWIIVDDGSSDGTGELVTGWLESSSLTIRYVFQENAGKHVAFNRGVREARGDLFLTLDSDDECVPQALERLLHHWESIPPAARAGFSAVTVLCQDEEGGIVGEPFPQSPYDSDSLHRYFRRVGQGEKWGFQRTDVLRQLPYPEPAGIKFVPESVVWFAIARDYRTRYVNEPLRIYHGDVGGPRLSRLTAATACGRLLLHRDVATKYIDFMPTFPRAVVRSGINFSRYSYHCGVGPLGQVRSVPSPASRALVATCLLPGLALFVRDVATARLATRTDESDPEPR